MPLWKPPKYTVVSGASPLTTTTGDNNGLSPGITYASPLLPFYGSGTIIPSTISVSTLNAYQANIQSTLTVGGAGQTLTGAGGELLINGQPLATVSTLSNWATFPALSTLQMNGNKMIGVSSISGVSGQPLPIIASNVEFGGLGQLTGISTINGAPPGSGNASAWATYPATVDVNLNSKNLNSANQVNMNTGGNVVMLTAGTGNTLYINGAPIPYPPPPTPPVPSTITGQNTYMTATGGTFATANSIITAGGGLGGSITATANAGDLGVSGGNVSLTANGGTGLGGLFGVVNLTANPGTDLVSGIATGGAINILANSPVLGLTSKVSITAGGLNLYSGVFTPIASVFGYTYINASLGISLVAGGFTSAFQSPGTVYLYGAQGIVLDNGVYANDIQPIWDGNPLNPPAPLTIHGRTAGGSNAPVILNNVKNIQMEDVGGITGVKSITGTSGTDLVLDAATGTKLTLTGGSTPAGIPDASLSLQTDGSIIINNSVGSFPITDGTGLIISSEGNVIAFPPSATATVIGSITGLATINGSPYPPTPVSFGVASLNTLTGSLNLTSASGSLVLGVSSPNIDLRANGIKSANGFVSLECGTDGSLAGTVDTAGTNPFISINGNAGSEIGIPASGDVKLTTPSSSIRANNSGTVQLRSLNSSDITVSTGNIPGGGQQIIVSTGSSPPTTGLYVSPTNLYFNGIPLTNFKDSFQIYVAPNGSLTYGDGSQQNPLSTISQAIALRASLSTSVEVSIIVSSGTYTENFTLVRNTYLVGVQTGEARQPVNIVGNIVLNDTTGVMGLSGLEITGSVSATGGGATYTLFGCNITNTTTAVFATAGTVFITECRISASTGVVVIVFGTATIRDCSVITTGTSSCIQSASTTIVRQCVITSTSANTLFQPLISLITTSGSLVVEFCRLEYTSTNTDTGGNKCCIKFNNTSGALSASVVQSLLLCEGATTGSPQIQCIQKATGGTATLSYGTLIAGATAHNIAPTITKTAYTPVP